MVYFSGKGNSDEEGLRVKGKFPWKDMLVLGGALAAAIAGVAAIQAVSGRIDGVASMVFVLAAFFVSMYTEGYLWGVAATAS